MDDVNLKAEELANQMDFDFFNKKLQDEVRLFKQYLNEGKGKDLSKNELKRLLEFAVRLPDVDGITITPNMKDLCHVINEAKYSFLSMNLQYLIEEGKKQAEQDQIAPAFKGEE